MNNIDSDFLQLKIIIESLRPDLQFHQIQISDPVHDYIDSIVMLELLLQIENTFNVIIEPSAIRPSDFDTFEKLCNFIARLKS